MVRSVAPTPLSVHLECVSWHLVQHHLGHGALRFEPAVLAHWRHLTLADDSRHCCLATLADNPIEVVGALLYRIADDDLYFDYIRVRRSCRRQGIGRRMLSAVVTHPTCIHLGRLHWLAEGSDCQGLIRHLEWLRDHGRRLCGTSFRLLRGKSPALAG